VLSKNRVTFCGSTAANYYGAGSVFTYKPRYKSPGVENPHSRKLIIKNRRKPRFCRRAVERQDGQMNPEKHAAFHRSPVGN